MTVSRLSKEFFNLGDKFGSKFKTAGSKVSPIVNDPCKPAIIEAESLNSNTVSTQVSSCPFSNLSFILSNSVSFSTMPIGFSNITVGTESDLYL